MARPIKRGIDYFPVDVDISEDPAVAYLEAVHGLVGYAVYLKLLALIYRGDGYYTSWDERDRIVFARSAHLAVEEIDSIVATATEVGLFDEGLLVAEGVLTSRGIQARFREITRKRKAAEIDPRIDMLDESSEFIPSFCGGNSEVSTQRKGKGKERKAVSRTCPDSASGAGGYSPGTQTQLTITNEDRQNLIDEFGSENAEILLEDVRLESMNGLDVRSWYALARRWGLHRVRQGQMRPPSRTRPKCTNPDCIDGWVLDGSDDCARSCPECGQSAPSRNIEKEST